MYSNIGEFICEKRMAKNITLRKLAKMLSISVTFLADIEHGRRNPMELDKLNELAEVLDLSEEEKNEMFDLAGKKRKEVAPDLKDYVVGNTYISYALRKARDMGAGEEEWLKMVEDLERRTKERSK